MKYSSLDILFASMLVGIGCDYATPTDVDRLEARIDSLSNAVDETNGRASENSTEISRLEGRINLLEREKEASQLRTQLHTETGGTWEVLDGTVTIEEISWRFISERELIGAVVVTGTYKMTWINDTSKRLRINYEIRFSDRHYLQIARYVPSSYDVELTLPSNQSREETGNFEITVGNTGVANSITRMIVAASFEES